VADPVAADVEEIRDAVAPRPVAQHLALQRGVGVFGGGHVVDDRLDFPRVEHAVLAAGGQVEDGGGSGDLVAEDRVQAQDPHVLGRPVDHVAIEDLLRYGFSHVLFSPFS